MAPPPPVLEAELELTEEQRSIFDQLKADYRRTVRSLENSFFNLVSEYFGLLRERPTGTQRQAEESARLEAEIAAMEARELKARAAALELELAQLEAEKVRVTFEHFRALQEVLTPEQREKFNVILPELVERMAPPAVVD